MQFNLPKTFVDEIVKILLGDKVFENLKESNRVVRNHEHDNAPYLKKPQQKPPEKVGGIWI